MKAIALIIIIFFPLVGWAADMPSLPPIEIMKFLLDGNEAVSDEGLLPENPQALAFAKYVVLNWREVEKNLQKLAPDARRQKLFVVAAEFLPPQDYVVFASKICDFRESGLITPDAVQAIVTARMFKDGFLAYNYDNPDVRKLIIRLETIMQKDEPQKWTELFSEMKTGKARDTILKEAKLHNDLLPEVFNGKPSDAYYQLINGK